jgi:hypothetical protein
VGLRGENERILITDNFPAIVNAIAVKYPVWSRFVIFDTPDNVVIIKMKIENTNKDIKAYIFEYRNRKLQLNSYQRYTYRFGVSSFNSSV